MTEVTSIQKSFQRIKDRMDSDPVFARSVAVIAAHNIMFRKFEKPDTALMEFCRIIDRCRDQCRMMGMTEDEIKDMEEDARTISYTTFESMPDAYQELVKRKRKEWLKR